MRIFVCFFAFALLIRNLGMMTRTAACSVGRSPWFSMQKLDFSPCQAVYFDRTFILLRPKGQQKINSVTHRLEYNVKTSGRQKKRREGYKMRITAFAESRCGPTLKLLHSSGTGLNYKRAPPSSIHRNVPPPQYKEVYM